MQNREEILYARLSSRLDVVLNAVTPIDPPPQYWLESDCCASYCRQHARDARWIEMGNVGPTWPDQDWYRRDEINRNMNEGIGCYMPHNAGEGDSSAVCDTCGCTLDYILTDYGVEQEIDYWLENPLAIVRDEDSYALDRLCLNIYEGSPRRILIRALAAVNQAWRIVERKP